MPSYCLKRIGKDLYVGPHGSVVDTEGEARTWPMPAHPHGSTDHGAADWLREFLPDYKDAFDVVEVGK